MSKKIKGLYIHIPFCDVICSYCDFYKMVAKDSKKIQFINYLNKELELKKDNLKTIETIFIGGGTPTSLDLNLLEKLFIKLHSLIDFKKIIEFTIEANPCDINQELIDLLMKYQVNRISLGIQSFDSSVLKVLGRTHTKDIAIGALDLLKKNNFDNINVDLIYGIKEDTFKRVKSDIKLAKRKGAKHFSVYSLIIEEKTLLSYLMKKDKFTRLDDANDTKIYYRMVKYLKRHKFHQYEISNFSKKGYQSIHNLLYWNNEEYIGVGPAASYYYDQTRFTNINHLNEYFRGIDEKNLVYQEESILTLDQQMIDEIMMGFRKTQGVNILRFKDKYSKDIFEAFPKIKDLMQNGFISSKGEYLFIPKNKLFILNAILVAIM